MDWQVMRMSVSHAHPSTDAESQLAFESSAPPPLGGNRKSA